jgi:uncharacterized membrane protein YgdD (TMEM256/DUF423 family)
MNNLNLIRLLLLFVGISGAFSVLFGAWFAHAGQTLSVVDKMRIENAQFYQFIHTLALFVSIVWYTKSASKWLLSSAVCFSLGILCFSGSLYVKTFFALTSIGAVIGKLAPVGGMLLALAWLCLIFVSKKSLESNN